MAGLERSEAWWIEKAVAEGNHPVAAGTALTSEEVWKALHRFKEQLAALTAWRPIETAPHDGTHIRAMIEGTTFGYINGYSLGPIQSVVHWWDNPGEEGFYTSVNERAPDLPFAATHWKPLD